MSDGSIPKKKRTRRGDVGKFLHSLPETFEEWARMAHAAIQCNRVEKNELKRDDDRLRIILQQRIMVIDHLKQIQIEDGPDRDLLVRKGYIRERKDRV